MYGSEKVNVEPASKTIMGQYLKQLGQSFMFAGSMLLILLALLLLRIFSHV